MSREVAGPVYAEYHLDFTTIYKTASGVHHAQNEECWLQGADNKREENKNQCSLPHVAAGRPMDADDIPFLGATGGYFQRAKWFHRQVHRSNSGT